MDKEQFISIKRLLGKLAERMKKDKRVELAVYAVLVLIGVAIFLSTSLGGKAKTEAGEKADAVSISQLSKGERDIEERLSGVLSRIRGAGKVEVMITYDTGTEIVPAMSTDTQTSTSENTTSDGGMVTENKTESSRPATVSGSNGNEAIVLTERMPEIRGVIVIAEGAANIAVRVNLQNAVKTVLGIDVSRIEVFEMGLLEGE